MTDYATLQTDIAAWLARDDLTDRIPSFIRLAEDAIYRKLRQQSMLKICSATADSTLPGGEYVASLPSDFLELKTIESNGMPLTQKSIRQLSVDAVHSYALTGGMVAVSPDSLAIDLYYYARPVRVEADANSWFIEHAYDALLWGGVYQGRLYQKDFDAAAAAKVQFDEIYAQLEDAALSDEYSGDGIAMRRG